MVPLPSAIFIHFSMTIPFYRWYHEFSWYHRWYHLVPYIFLISYQMVNDFIFCGIIYYIYHWYIQMVPFVLNIIITKILTKNITTFSDMVGKCTPLKILYEILLPYIKKIRFFYCFILEKTLKTHFPDYKVDHFQKMFDGTI